MMMPNRKGGGAGFTLLEFVVVLAVLAIVTTFALPAFDSLLASSRVRSAAGQLHAALLFARSEAIKRNQTVTLTCTSGSCAAGWTVTVGTTELAKQNAFADTRLTITGATGATFARTGRSSGLQSFSVRRTDQNAARCVKLYLSGLPEVLEAGC